MLCFVRPCNGNVQVFRGNKPTISLKGKPLVTPKMHCQEDMESSYLMPTQPGNPGYLQGYSCQLSSFWQQIVCIIEAYFYMVEGLVHLPGAGEKNEKKQQGHVLPLAPHPLLPLHTRGFAGGAECNLQGYKARGEGLGVKLSQEREAERCFL